MDQRNAPNPDSPAERYPRKKREVQNNLTRKSTLEELWNKLPSLKVLDDDLGAGRVSPANLWDEERDYAVFRTAALAGAEVWAYDSVSTYLGFSAGETGFAAVSEGQVVSWITSEIIG